MLSRVAGTVLEHDDNYLLVASLRIDMSATAMSPFAVGVLAGASPMLYLVIGVLVVVAAVVTALVLTLLWERRGASPE